MHELRTQIVVQSRSVGCMHLSAKQLVTKGHWCRTFCTLLRQDLPNEVGSKEVEKASPAHHDNNPVSNIPTPLAQRLQHTLPSCCMLHNHITQHAAGIMLQTANCILHSMLQTACCRQHVACQTSCCRHHMLQRASCKQHDADMMLQTGCCLSPMHMSVHVACCTSSSWVGQ